MNRNLHLLVVAVLVAVIATSTPVVAVSGAELQTALAPSAEDSLRSITVIGRGKVSLEPDVGQVNVGAEARAETVSAAKDQVDRQIAAVRAALDEMGIAEEDIQTQHFSINLEREAMPGVPQSLVGESPGMYRVSNMLRVTVRDVEKAGDVLDAVVEAGANQVFGVTFTVSDENEWQGRAREKAVADAKARAEALAGLAGVELGQVQSVSEVVSPWPVDAVMERGLGGGFAPGALEFSTQLQVTFAIR